MPDLSKLDTLLHKTYIKVLRVDMCRSLISLMWHDHPFSQRNKTTEIAVGWGLEAARKGKGVGQNLKKKKKKKKKKIKTWG